MTMTSVTPAEAQRLIRNGAKLIDIRAPDEHAREHIPGADNVPLAEIDRLRAGDCPVVFHCRSGARTGANVARLSAAAAGAPCYLIEGGIDAWRRAGLEVAADRRQPLELMRQVQLAAGGLVLLGVALGFLVGPGFFALSAFVGAGLMLAGGTGWCGMARLLRHMPWNRRMAA
ncbi:Rhodanese-related sulfurtransferase [Sphingobium faniae]|uniref:rhodanese family protein n=1 Tax=Rhizorhapis sp. SPR117 TaxID=2912611 RepID=UPI000875F156|nr:rhodanese family protein [Rhizorhapis sp. SPR117]SCW89233.1 Rhodanese-related sulfurtransferase [Sphingobium faniae]